MTKQPSWIALVTSILATLGAAFAYLDGRGTNTGGAKSALLGVKDGNLSLVRY